jgi:hypothetical protein
MSDIETVSSLIDNYLAAYCEPDRVRRSSLVRRVFADDARLIDPPLTAQGHTQIEAQAETLLTQFVGHRFRRSSGIDVHNGHARYSWQLVDADGKVRLEGQDMAQIDDHGLLSKVVGFFGPLPPLHTAA